MCLHFEIHRNRNVCGQMHTWTSPASLMAKLYFFIIGHAHRIACHLCNIDSSIVPYFEPFCVPSFEPKTDELKDFSCCFRAWFVLFSCLVRAIFEPCLCHFRAWLVPRSNLVCAIFEPGSFHFRAWFVPFSSLVRSIFEPGSCHFRPCFLLFSSPLRAIFEHSSCWPPMQPPYFLCQGNYNGLYDKLLHFNVKKRVAECVLIDHHVRVAKLQKIVLFTRSTDRKL